MTAILAQLANRAFAPPVDLLVIFAIILYYIAYAAVIALLVAGWNILLHYFRLYRQSHIKPGCCRHCGYDLRESPVRCPECGTRIPNPPCALYPYPRSTAKRQAPQSP